jgi:hypothetical protein
MSPLPTLRSAAPARLKWTRTTYVDRVTKDNGVDSAEILRFISKNYIEPMIQSLLADKSGFRYIDSEGNPSALPDFQSTPKDPPRITAKDFFA